MTSASSADLWSALCPGKQLSTVTPPWRPDLHRLGHLLLRTHRVQSDFLMVARTRRSLLYIHIENQKLSPLLIVAGKRG